MLGSEVTSAGVLPSQSRKYLSMVGVDARNRLILTCPQEAAEIKKTQQLNLKELRLAPIRFYLP